MWGGSDEAESIKTIQHAVDIGINLIDTAIRSTRLGESREEPSRVRNPLDTRQGRKDDRSLGRPKCRST